MVALTTWRHYDATGCFQGMIYWFLPNSLHMQTHANMSSSSSLLIEAMVGVESAAGLLQIMHRKAFRDFSHNKL